MKFHARKFLVATVGVIAIATTSLVPGSGALAYEPGPGEIYTAAESECTKQPCVLYPKSAELPSGRLVMTFENSVGPVIGQTLPLYKSDDDGTSWQKLTDVQAPAFVDGRPEFAAYTSNWTNPFFYVLPQSVGNLAAGTLLLSSVVSGGVAGTDQRTDPAIVLYSSIDEGASWQMVSVIVTGGTDLWADPVWEPYLMVHDGKLVVYYSDEHEDNFFPASVAGQYEGGQILAHKTSTDGVNWSAAVEDVGTDFYSGRPGMTNIVPTTDGKWLLTFEYWGGGAHNRIKVCADPLACDPSDLGTEAPSWWGGSPVLLAMPDGRIVYNDASSGDVLVNESGRSDGAWKRYKTPVVAGYSRNLQYVEDTGRVVILSAPWWHAGVSVGPVTHGEVDLGYSTGSYFSIVNRQTGQLISTDANKTQDAIFTGDVPDLISWSDNPSNATQRWHVLTDSDGTITFLNKAGGRSIATWQGNAVSGQRLAQWVDDGAADKRWTLVPTTDGYYRIRSVLNPNLYVTGASAGGAIDLQPLKPKRSDDVQEWRLVAEPTG